MDLVQRDFTADRPNHLRVADLSSHMSERASYADAYLDVIDTVLRRATTDPPSP